jgi:hypothetical protein
MLLGQNHQGDLMIRRMAAIAMLVCCVLSCVGAIADPATKPLTPPLPQPSPLKDLKTAL